jgi:hypothetical protein
MSSESNDQKPESVEPGPPSGAKARQSARAPSTWGAVRDAVSSVHNLGALLRSTSVKYKVIRDLLPELRSCAVVLRELFTPAGATGDAGQTGDDEATREVCAYGLLCAGKLEELLDATALANDERDDLAPRSLDLAGQLEAASDLLALLDRSAIPIRTSVSMRLIVLETGRLWGGTRGGDIAVRFDDSEPDRSIDVDPYVVGPLLSLVLGLVRAGGVGEVVVRARTTGAEAALSVEPAGPADAGFKTVSVRILPCVPPAEKAVREVASRIGAALELDGVRAVLRFQPAAEPSTPSTTG